MDRDYYNDALRNRGYAPETLCPRCKEGFHKPQDCENHTYKIRGPNFDRTQKIVEQITDELEPSRRRESLQRERHQEWDAEDREEAQKERRRQQQQMQREADKQRRKADEERRLQRAIEEAMKSPIGSPASSEDEVGGQGSSSQAGRRKTDKQLRFSLPPRRKSRS